MTKIYFHSLKSQKQMITLTKDFTHGRVGIRSERPIHDFVQYRLLLNLLLATIFKLEPYIKAEGGIAGTRVHLVNDRGLTLGLQRDPELHEARASLNEKEILSYYAQVLHLLFIEGSIGRVQPKLLWTEERFKDAHHERFLALSDAATAATWHFDSAKTIGDKGMFFLKEYMPRIEKLRHHLYGDEFLPLSERGIYLRMMQNIKA